MENVFFFIKKEKVGKFSSKIKIKENANNVGPCCMEPQKGVNVTVKVGLVLHEEITQIVHVHWAVKDTKHTTHIITRICGIFYYRQRSCMPFFLKPFFSVF